MKEYLTDLLNKVMDGLGNILFAVIILIVALVVANLVKSLVVKGLKAIKLDQKLAGFGIANPKGLIDLVAKIVWFVVFLLFMPAVFSQLGMNSITGPINQLVSEMLGFVPKMIAAGILFAVGVILGDIVKQISEPVLKAAKVDALASKVGVKAPLSAILSTILKVVVVVFFAIQAINALGLTVLTNVGSAIINYIPAVISSVIIAIVALFAGSTIEKIIAKTNPKAKGFAAIVKVIIYVVAVFMVLSQLHIASAIVETAFKYLVLGISIAIAVAFGVGGRDFAKNMLAKLEKKIDDNN